MRKFTIAILAGAGALFTGGANATDIYTTSEYVNPDIPLVQPVRTVCDEDGRCYRTRGGSRVIVRDSYGYAPRERYIERRTYRDWDDGPRAGVGIRTPGVSVGVGVSSHVSSPFLGRVKASCRPNHHLPARANVPARGVAKSTSVSGISQRRSAMRIALGGIGFAPEMIARTAIMPHN